jgi:hypothetical protein
MSTNVGVGESNGSEVSDAVGVAVGVGVMDGRGERDGLAVAVCDGTGVGVGLSAASGAARVAQASNERVGTARSNVFLIAALASQLY